MKNLEFKAEVVDAAALRNAFEENGARFVGTLDQRDTYFSIGSGRLKLRETEGKQPELIFYKRNETSPSEMESRYSILPVRDSSMKAFLSEALGVKTVVEKTRRLMMLNNARIHLDEVKGLGSFLEFEVVSAESGDAGDKQDATLLRQLKNIAAPFVVREINESYSDMALKK